MFVEDGSFLNRSSGQGPVCASAKAQAALAPGWLPLDPSTSRAVMEKGRPGPSLKNEQSLSCSGQEFMGLNKYLSVVTSFLPHALFLSSYSFMSWLVCVFFFFFFTPSNRPWLSPSSSLPGWLSPPGTPSQPPGTIQVGLLSHRLQRHKTKSSRNYHPLLLVIR